MVVNSTNFMNYFINSKSSNSKTFNDFYSARLNKAGHGDQTGSALTIFGGLFLFDKPSLNRGLYARTNSGYAVNPVLPKNTTETTTPAKKTTPTAPIKEEKVILSEDERVYLNKVLLGKDNKGASNWHTFEAFAEMADTNGDGKVSEEEKDSCFKKLINSSSDTAQKELQAKHKGIVDSWASYRKLEKETGDSKSLNGILSLEEFSKKVGADLANKFDAQGDKNISRLEFRKFTEMADLDKDGTISDEEYAAIKEKNSKGEINIDKSKMKEDLNRTNKLNTKRVEFYSDEFRKNDVSKVKDVIDTEGDYGFTDHLAFTRFADQNGDKIISPLERQYAMERLKTAEGKAELKGKSDLVDQEVNKFKAVDKDGDGKMSDTEMQAYLKTIVNDDTKAKQLATKLKDTNGNDLKSFISLMEYANTNKDNDVSNEEITKAINNLSTKTTELYSIDSNTTLSEAEKKSLKSKFMDEFHKLQINRWHLGVVEKSHSVMTTPVMTPPPLYKK